MTRWLAIAACWWAFWPVSSAAAQTQPPRFRITDNSFLVEEAFNQEAGIFQNIFVVTRSRNGQWDGSFTQEWPLGGSRHQLSFTLPFSLASGLGEVSDVLLNYRLQVCGEGRWRPAFSPRVSAVFASSPERRSLGPSGTGIQVNLPVSKAFDRFYVHANAGATWLKEPADEVAHIAEHRTATPSAAGSLIWAATPMFHVMLEVYGQSAEQTIGSRENIVIIVPGFRTGWNFGDRQVVAGFGASFTRGDVQDNGVLFYLSVEMPFVKK
jgi:hypothetical protein